MHPEIQRYIAAKPARFQSALTWLHAEIRAILPDHSECMSYAMPGFRDKGGKMVIGYAAFARHIGIYPHSGGIIPKLDCRPFKASKSGITFAPEHLPPRQLIAQIIAARQAEIAAGQ